MNIIKMFVRIGKTLGICDVALTEICISWLDRIGIYTGKINAVKFCFWELTCKLENPYTRATSYIEYTSRSFHIGPAGLNGRGSG